MSVAKQPVLDDDTTLPRLIDFHARHNADSPFALFPTSTLDEEFTMPDASAVTFFEFARACHRFAHVAAGIARPGEVVGLIATADTLLYITALAGFVYAGITVFPISPRNSPAAILHMLRKVSAHRLMITASQLQPLISGINHDLSCASDAYELVFHELPELPAIYPHLAHEQLEDHFDPFCRPADNIHLQTVALYLHSSGSTGFPKPIPYTQGVIAGHRFGPLNVDLGKDRRSITFGAMALPSFHAMGVYSQLFYPLFTGRPVAIFAPQYPRLPTVSSPGIVLEAMERTKTNVVFVVPTFLETWVQNPNTVAYLRTLYLAVFAGGPLATSVGNALVSAGVTLAAIYGGTEFGIPTRIMPAIDKRPEDWAWLSFSDHTRPRWIDLGDGQYELQLLASETHNLSIEDLPDRRGYATRDVWVPHPTRAGLWRIVGRVDDVIMLSNGEKVVPGPMEGVIMSSPLVQGAVMFGRERNQVGLLVEPALAHAIDPKDEAAFANFRKAIWPKVDEANQDAPTFSRIHKEMILVTQPGKSLARTPKGTVQRKAALSAYEPEIQAIYTAAERSSADGSVVSPSGWTIPEISHWLALLCSSVQDGRKIDADVDLFEQGFDSLSAAVLRNRIVMGVRALPKAVAEPNSTAIRDDIIYANPRITKLAAATFALVHAGDTQAPSPATLAITEMIAKYSVDMSRVDPTNTGAPSRGGEVVLLTGSTGGLGSQLLARCLADEKVARVYALNRVSKGASVRARLMATFVDRGLDVGVLDSPKLVLLEGSATQDWLGLSPETYEEVRTSVTGVIHNAWRLDFNLALASFEPHVRGTRRLLDLALSSPHAARVRVLFISSIAAAQAWPRERGVVPEEAIGAACAVGNGYGESKYVCEQLLVKAAEHGLSTTSFRIGQITGNKPRGAWATTDWLPILLKSSLALRCLPDAVGMGSWIPFDAVGQAILDVTFADTQPERTLHIVHPHPFRWRALFTDFADVLASGTKQRLPLVSWTEWYGRLRALATHSNEDGLAAGPAVKLLPFFAAQAAADAAAHTSHDGARREAAGLPDLSTAKAQDACPSLRGLAALTRADVESWVAYWRERGFLPGHSRVGNTS